VYSIFKYLMAWQVVALIIYWFFQNYWGGTWEDVAALAFMVLLFGFVYSTDRKYKTAAGEPTITPTEEATIVKAIDIFCNELGIDLTGKKDKQIELLKELTERQAERIAELEKTQDG